MNRRDFMLLAAGSVAQFASAGSRAPTVQCAGEKGKRPLVRFGVVSDPHFGDLESTMPPGEVRAFRESDTKMREFVEVMNSRGIDFVVELGDFVEQHPSRAATVKALDRIEKVFREFKGPTYHVIGNHDLAVLERSEFLSRVTNTGIESGRSYYSFVAGSVTFVVLDHGYYSDGAAMRPGNVDWQKGHLSPEEFKWLEKTIQNSSGKVVVFSHWRIDSETGVYPGLQAKDSEKVRKLLRSSAKVVACFSGHDHKGAFSYTGESGYYVLRAMCTGSGKDSSSYVEVSVYASGRVEIVGFNKARSIAWDGR